jgi:hypothetical protein
MGGVVKRLRPLGFYDEKASKFKKYIKHGALEIVNHCSKHLQLEFEGTVFVLEASRVESGRVFPGKLSHLQT